LALFNLPGGASFQPNGALMAGKLAGSAAPSASADGFAAFVLAAAAIPAQSMDGAFKLVAEPTASDIPLPGLKIEASKDVTAKEPTPQEEKNDAAPAPTNDALAALALLPLPAAPPVLTPTLTDEVKAAFVAAAAPKDLSGKTDAETPDKTMPGLPAIPVPVTNSSAAAEASVTAPSAAATPVAAPGATVPSSPDDTTALLATGNQTNPQPASITVDAQAAAAVPDLVPPEAIPRDPTAVLSDARKTTQGKAATGQAQGAQTDVLAAARDLVGPAAAMPNATASRSLEPPSPQQQQAGIHTPASGPKLEGPTAQNAAPDAQPKTEHQASATAKDVPVPVPSHSAATDPAPVPGAAKTEASPLQAASVASAAPQSDARPAPMTVIRAEVQAGHAALPTDQIAVTIARQFRQGTNRFEIRLDPPELGRIDVRLDLGHGGRATATLTADRPETLALLTRDSRALEQMLSDAGVRTDSGSLNFALRDQSGRSGQQDQQDNTPLPKEAPESSDTKTVSVVTASLEPGRLDLRV
jgi:flagellar hook-length control protein FliK